MHLLELPKLKKELDGKMDADSGADLFQTEQKRILNEERYTFGYLRQSIELSEKSSNKALNLTLFDELLALDLEEEGIENLTSEQEADYFSLLQGENVGKAVTNLAEYLLMTQAMKGEIKVSKSLHFSRSLHLCLECCVLVPPRTQILRTSEARGNRPPPNHAGALLCDP